ncbi:hypothetical protein V8F20_012026 [Naviculisporaceae sp. PSN 640]
MYPTVSFPIVTALLGIVSQTAARSVAIPDIENANQNNMETRQSLQRCSIAGTSARVNCRASPTRSSSSVVSFLPGESFGVECMVDGEGIDGEKAWGYLPSFACWVAVRWTDLGCKRKLPTC